MFGAQHSIPPSCCCMHTLGALLERSEGKEWKKKGEKRKWQALNYFFLMRGYRVNVRHENMYQMGDNKYKIVFGYLFYLFIYFFKKSLSTKSFLCLLKCPSVTSVPPPFWVFTVSEETYSLLFFFLHCMCRLNETRLEWHHHELGRGCSLHISWCCGCFLHSSLEFHS